MMSPALTRRHLLYSTFAAAICVLSSGCSVIPISGDLPFMNLGAKEEPAVEPNSTCTVEMRFTGGRTKTVEVPLSSDSRIQNVLDASQASKKFRNLDVQLLRKTEHASQPVLRMDCQFDRRKRQISWETDYAVRPGDKIQVQEDTKNPLDNFFGAVLGPLVSRK